MYPVNNSSDLKAVFPSMQVEKETCKKLLNLFQSCQSSSLEKAKKQFDELPEKCRNTIYAYIYLLAGEPKTTDFQWGEHHVLDSLPQLANALQFVAFEAFDLLPNQQKEIVEGKVYFNSGSPKTDDYEWGKHHVKDDVEILLKSMNDCPDEKELILTIVKNWEIKGRQDDLEKVRAQLKQDPTNHKQNELFKLLENGRGELENRHYCRRPIKEWLNNQSEKLSFNLSLTRVTNPLLSLTSLPAIFNFPLFTKKLKVLEMESMYLSILIPEIGQLHELEELTLSCNKFIQFPMEIIQLNKLKRLSFGLNKLTTIPSEINQMQGLEKVNFMYNPLVSLPSEIGQLRNLKFLNLTCCSSLTGLPMEILNLPSTCTVELTRCGLSNTILQRLREATQAPNYTGPRFSFSMGNVSQHKVRPIEESLKELYNITKEIPQEFPNLKGINDMELASWLSRLSDVADYKKGGVLQIGLARMILKYLQLANDDAIFRDEFFVVIDGASETCGDRVALSILYMGLNNQLAKIDLKDFKGLYQLLIRGVWAVSMLETIAREKVKTLSFYDEIEVYLGYPVMLKENLNLCIDIKEMLYFACSALKEKDLQIAEEFVLDHLNNENACYNFLISQVIWEKALRLKFPNECAEIDHAKKQLDEDSKRVENFDYISSKEKIDAMWIKLTKDVLNK